jgi:hypothetical protein
MTWAIELTISDQDTIEQRLQPILGYISSTNKIMNIQMKDIDATGKIGDLLTKKLNLKQGPLTVEANDLNSLITEEGQIFELDLLLKSDSDYRIIIRSCGSIDILGNGKLLPAEIIGEHEVLDIKLFYP